MTAQCLDRVLRAYRFGDPAPVRAYGEASVRRARSAILIVPSVVARLDNNVLINPARDDARGIKHSLHQPVWWDERLFGGGLNPGVAHHATPGEPESHPV